MKKFVPLLLVLIANTAPEPASQGITYDCDTASGHFSSLVLPVPPGSFTVQGKVQPRALADIGKWTPATRLTIVSRLADAGAVPDDGAGFTILALPAKMIDKRAGKGIVQFVKWQENQAGKQTESEPFAIQPAMQAMDFSLRYDGKAVAMAIGGAETRVAVSKPMSAVRIICSTGEFLYTDLMITPGSQ
ncbi:hypothetical protein [Blastomonas sp. SL216]|uniref:hypothetical protein n=1 Tax=Blastomonas sp. SL216 TaxID=2995169 RepID=UPI00237792C9|nr:hypothetical protein OU999_05105 [Blastomonas sp. SL216]